MAIVTLDVTGQILHPDLTPAVGTVSFQIPIDLNDVVANVTYTPATFTETLDAFGMFTITGLIATDSPDLAESGAWMYRVHVLTDAYAESFSTSLPLALAPVADFTDLIPAQSQPCTDDGTPCATVAQFADLQAQIDALGPGGGVQSVNGDAGPDVVLTAAEVGADPAGAAAAALIAANAYTDAEIAALPPDAVTSVNGLTGVVVLNAASVGADPAGSAAAAQAAAIAAANAYTDAEIAALPPDAVTSVNGQTGVVVLDAGDVGADPAGSAAAAQAAAIAAANAYTDAEIAALPPDAVTSVNGQTGVVVLDAGDVGADVAGAAAAAQAAAIASSNAYTDTEISTLDGLVVHLAGVESITGVKTFTADPVFNVGAIPQTAVASLVADLALKADESITLTAGIAMSGGGDLSANRTFDVDLGQSATTAAEGRAPWFGTAPMPISGRYVYTTYGATGTVVPGLDSARYSPLPVWTGFTATSISVEVTTLQATSVVRLGLYADSGAGLPAALITDFGTVSAASTGVKTISPGGGIVFADRTLYWLCAVVQVAGGTAALRTSNYHDTLILPSSTGVTNSTINAYVQAGVSGALGSPAVPADASGGPRFMLLIA